MVHAGPLALNKLTSSATTIFGLRLAYAKAIQHIMIFAVAIVCVSILAASGMQWLNIKKVAEDRKARQEGESLNINQMVGEGLAVQQKVSIKADSVEMLSKKNPGRLVD